MAGTVEASGQQVLVTRVFDAPRELVFKAWTDSRQLLRWFAPNGCTTPVCNVDFRVGGSIHMCIRTPGGMECWSLGRYREIIVPERIVYSLAFSDAEGRLVETGHIGLDPEWPRETIVTVTFAEEKGRTRLTLHQSVSEALAKRTGAYPSWLQMLDRLAEELATTSPK